MLKFNFMLILLQRWANVIINQDSLNIFQSRVHFTKIWDHFFVLQRETSGITKYGMYYKSATVLIKGEGSY